MKALGSPPPTEVPWVVEHRASSERAIAHAQTAHAAWQRAYAELHRRVGHAPFCDCEVRPMGEYERKAYEAERAIKALDLTVPKKRKRK